MLENQDDHLSRTDAGFFQCVGITGGTLDQFGKREVLGRLPAEKQMNGCAAGVRSVHMLKLLEDG